MASPGLELGEVQPPPDPPQPELAFTEAQKWIEQVTGRSFGEKDFRSGLENGILLCELLNAIKPGLVKKINRLPTPIAGLDNIILFLRGCKELGLKESQLFDPGDLQDTSSRVTIKNIDCSRKLKNVLVTIYWLGRAANNCTSYSGSTLNLKEFEGLLAQMRKETEDIESPKRSIRDSGYIDCWDSERSDSLSPPRHGRDDSFDSLDSFGSRSQQTPSPDVVLRGSSDGRGSDSETDLPHRKMPDVKKDDMLARRTSHGEPKSAVPFNQYLPNKSNQTFYVPAPLRKKKAEREEYRKSWSTATSPLGDRPFRFGPRTAVSDDAESMSMFDMRCEDEAVTQPHSKARHEKLQNINNQLKEDETRWQDDLARWKSRRRSASQDLIKKEAERKKMERLLSGDGANERRKSIKTYREIVEEKERRERELHEAYKNAKSQEEAESILQQYIERFTISEAVLERLQMPKILERSHSVEPNSPLKDQNPLRYLRQQSLPAPKFTATIEATIVPTTELEPSSSMGSPSPSKSIVSKAVPMLTPKPYSQPKNTQEVLKNFKVDGKVSMNGENFNGVEEKDKESTTVIFTPSPNRSLKFDGVARGDRPPVELKKDPTSVELSLQSSVTQSVHKEPTVRPARTNQPYFLCQFSVS
ncbi:LIM and calponin like proteiny domains-containing protein 1 [Amazona aestiva]|uniref:LIM and calponin like proteiny domains-containing protein 1 n=1 Tax=Amazona aestiva TaxID=12930 RepID=A0A0Q3Q7C6_AMAAE|nr:LIM and calponin like proteiny domains-containing protein 1 [Amazona aestiva]